VKIDPEVEARHEPERTVLAAWVEHHPGVLSEVSGLFSRRQFNIDSLTVGPTNVDGEAHITLVITEPRPGVEQARKQLEKLVPVIEVTELDEGSVERELALIKVDGDRPEQVNAIADMYRGEVVDVAPESLTVEVTGPEEKIDAAISSFERFGVREVVRTGTAAMARGSEDNQ